MENYTQRIAIVAVVLVVAGGGLAGSVAGNGGTASDAVDCTFPVTVTDGTGTDVTLSEEPDRVVVLGPSAAQTMWAIGAEEKVVGMPVNRYTAYLDGSEERTNVVGQRGMPIQETVLGQEPDLVLAPNIIPEQTIESLRDAGLTVYYFEGASSMADLATKTERTGQLVGAFDAAASEAAQMRGTVDAIESAVGDEERPRVYYALGGGFSTGNGTFIHDALTTAGGQNVVAEAGVTGYEEINPEIVAEQNPEILVVPTGLPVPSGAAFNGTTAVQEGNIVRVNANFLNQPGPRTAGVLANLTAGLHPSVAGDIDPETVETPEPTTCLGELSTPTATPSQSPTPTPATNSTGDSPVTATPTDTPGSSGPGFGPVVAMLALLGVALFARR